MIHAMNDARNERTNYTNVTQTNEKRKKNERYTNDTRTIHANETKEKRKRYEISVNLNDPGSVSDNPSYYFPLTTSNLANGMSATTFS